MDVDLNDFFHTIWIKDLWAIWKFRNVNLLKILLALLLQLCHFIFSTCHANQRCNESRDVLDDLVKRLLTKYIPLSMHRRTHHIIVFMWLSLLMTSTAYKLLPSAILRSMPIPTLPSLYDPSNGFVKFYISLWMVFTFCCSCFLLYTPLRF